MSPPNERGAGPDTIQASPTTAQDRIATTRARSYVHRTDAADRKAAQATLADAVRDLAHHHGDGRLLDGVAEAVIRTELARGAK
jgi:hypothetical protein